jgi:shikimate kinase
MLFKQLVIIFVCFNLFAISVNATSKIEKRTQGLTEITKEAELDRLYTKRRALYEAYLEIDQEIFKLQKEILEGINNKKN